jgi:hypothetical protein
MAEAGAEHGLAFVSFDCFLYALAAFGPHLSANVRCIDRWLRPECELMTHHPIIPAHALKSPLPLNSEKQKGNVLPSDMRVGK